MTHERHTLYATALSIASSPGLMKIWDRIKDAPPDEAYASLEAAGAPTAQEMIANRYPGSPVEAAKKIADACARREIRVVTLWDADYPPLLREISKPPLVLYCRGALPSRACISIVGTRSADVASRSIARRIAREISQEGFAIASGHGGRHRPRGRTWGRWLQGGMTIGVLATGSTSSIRRRNCDLYREILPAEKAQALFRNIRGHRAGMWTFARRNRIISGISKATVIVQAGEKRGRSLPRATRWTEQGGLCLRGASLRRQLCRLPWPHPRRREPHLLGGRHPGRSHSKAAHPQSGHGSGGMRSESGPVSPSPAAVRTGFS
jgi:predicted Rossmann fold nucleotide-binding protein DprA/Smf involved in DNA uptake